MPSNKCVFVVDNDPEMLRAVARLLTQHEYDPVPFASAEAFKSHNDFKQATCIILDINLKDGSGIVLQHALKASGIFVPVIYMTGNNSPSVRAAALQSGCLAYLLKPFSAKSLIEPLKSIERLT